MEKNSCRQKKGPYGPDGFCHPPPNKSDCLHYNNAGSVCQEENGLPRTDCLSNIKATIRFLSKEPLLEDLRVFDLTDIQWVILGGESGPKARPMKQEWIENIKYRCETCNTHFFFKQWGVWGADGIKRSKKANGQVFFGRTWDNMPALNASIAAVC